MSTDGEKKKRRIRRIADVDESFAAMDLDDETQSLQQEVRRLDDIVEPEDLEDEFVAQGADRDQGAASEEEEDEETKDGDAAAAAAAAVPARENKSRIMGLQQSADYNEKYADPRYNLFRADSLPETIRDEYESIRNEVKRRDTGMASPAQSRNFKAPSSIWENKGVSNIGTHHDCPETMQRLYFVTIQDGFDRVRYINGFAIWLIRSPSRFENLLPGDRARRLLTDALEMVFQTSKQVIRNDQNGSTIQTRSAMDVGLNDPISLSATAIPPSAPETAGTDTMHWLSNAFKVIAKWLKHWDATFALYYEIVLQSRKAFRAALANNLAVLNVIELPTILEILYSVADVALAIPIVSKSQLLTDAQRIAFDEAIVTSKAGNALSFDRVVQDFKTCKVKDSSVSKALEYLVGVRANLGTATSTSTSAAVTSARTPASLERKQRDSEGDSIMAGGEDENVNEESSPSPSPPPPSLYEADNYDAKRAMLARKTVLIGQATALLNDLKSDKRISTDSQRILAKHLETFKALVLLNEKLILQLELIQGTDGTSGESAPLPVHERIMEMAMASLVYGHHTNVEFNTFCRSVQLSSCLTRNVSDNLETLVMTALPGQAQTIERTKTMNPFDSGLVSLRTPGLNTRHFAAASDIEKRLKELRDLEMILKLAENRKTKYKARLSTGRAAAQALSLEEFEAAGREVETTKAKMSNLNQDIATLRLDFVDFDLSDIADDEPVASERPGIERSIEVKLELLDEYQRQTRLWISADNMARKYFCHSSGLRKLVVETNLFYASADDFATAIRESLDGDVKMDRSITRRNLWKSIVETKTRLFLGTPQSRGMMTIIDNLSCHPLIFSVAASTWLCNPATFKTKSTSEDQETLGDKHKLLADHCIKLMPDGQFRSTKHSWTPRVFVDVMKAAEDGLVAYKIDVVENPERALSVWTTTFAKCLTVSLEDGDIHPANIKQLLDALDTKSLLVSNQDRNASALVQFEALCIAMTYRKLQDSAQPFVLERLEHEAVRYLSEDAVACLFGLTTVAPAQCKRIRPLAGTLALRKTNSLYAESQALDVLSKATEVAIQAEIDFLSGGKFEIKTEDLRKTAPGHFDWEIVDALKMVSESRKLAVDRRSREVTAVIRAQAQVKAARAKDQALHREKLARAKEGQSAEDIEFVTPHLDLLNEETRDLAERRIPTVASGTNEEDLLTEMRSALKSFEWTFDARRDQGKHVLTRPRMVALDLRADSSITAVCVDNDGQRLNSEYTLQGAYINSDSKFSVQDHLERVRFAYWLSKMAHASLFLIDARHEYKARMFLRELSRYGIVHVPQSVAIGDCIQTVLSNLRNKDGSKIDLEMAEYIQHQEFYRIPVHEIDGEMVETLHEYAPPETEAASGSSYAYDLAECAIVPLEFACKLHITQDDSNDDDDGNDTAKSLLLRVNLCDKLDWLRSNTARIREFESAMTRALQEIIARIGVDMDLLYDRLRRPKFERFVLPLLSFVPGMGPVFAEAIDSFIRETVNPNDRSKRQGRLSQRISLLSRRGYDDLAALYAQGHTASRKLFESVARAIEKNKYSIQPPWPFGANVANLLLAPRKADDTDGPLHLTAFENSSPFFYIGSYCKQRLTEYDSKLDKDEAGTTINVKSAEHDDSADAHAAVAKREMWHESIGVAAQAPLALAVHAVDEKQKFVPIPLETGQDDRSPIGFACLADTMRVRASHIPSMLHAICTLMNPIGSEDDEDLVDDDNEWNYRLTKREVDRLIAKFVGSPTAVGLVKALGDETNNVRATSIHTVMSNFGAALETDLIVNLIEPWMHISHASINFLLSTIRSKTKVLEYLRQLVQINKMTGFGNLTAFHRRIIRDLANEFAFESREQVVRRRTEFVYSQDVLSTESSFALPAFTCHVSIDSDVYTYPEEIVMVPGSTINKDLHQENLNKLQIQKQSTAWFEEKYSVADFDKLQIQQMTSSRDLTVSALLEKQRNLGFDLRIGMLKRFSGRSSAPDALAACQRRIERFSEIADSYNKFLGSSPVVHMIDQEITDGRGSWLSSAIVRGGGGASDPSALGSLKTSEFMNQFHLEEHWRPRTTLTGEIGQLVGRIEALRQDREKLVKGDDIAVLSSLKVKSEEARRAYDDARQSKTAAIKERATLVRDTMKMFGIDAKEIVDRYDGQIDQTPVQFYIHVKEEQKRLESERNRISSMAESKSRAAADAKQRLEQRLESDEKKLSDAMSKYKMERKDTDEDGDEVLVQSELASRALDAEDADGDTQMESKENAKASRANADDADELRPQKKFRQPAKPVIGSAEKQLSAERLLIRLGLLNAINSNPTDRNRQIRPKLFALLLDNAASEQDLAQKKAARDKALEEYKAKHAPVAALDEEIGQCQGKLRNVRDKWTQTATAPQDYKRLVDDGDFIVCMNGILKVTEKGNKRESRPRFSKTVFLRAEKLIQTFKSGLPSLYVIDMAKILSKLSKTATADQVLIALEKVVAKYDQSSSAAPPPAQQTRDKSEARPRARSRSAEPVMVGDDENDNAETETKENSAQPMQLESRPDELKGIDSLFSEIKALVEAHAGPVLLGNEERYRILLAIKNSSRFKDQLVAQGPVSWSDRFIALQNNLDFLALGGQSMDDFEYKDNAKFTSADADLSKAMDLVSRAFLSGRLGMAQAYADTLSSLKQNIQKIKEQIGALETKQSADFKTGIVVAVDSIKQLFDQVNAMSSKNTEVFGDEIDMIANFGVIRETTARFLVIGKSRQAFDNVYSKAERLDSDLRRDCKARFDSLGASLAASLAKRQAISQMLQTEYKTLSGVQAQKYNVFKDAASKILARVGQILTEPSTIELLNSIGSLLSGTSTVAADADPVSRQDVENFTAGVKKSARDQNLSQFGYLARFVMKNIADLVKSEAASVKPAAVSADATDAATQTLSFDLKTKIKAALADSVSQEEQKKEKDPKAAKNQAQTAADDDGGDGGNDPNDDDADETKDDNGNGLGLGGGSKSKTKQGVKYKDLFPRLHLEEKKLLKCTPLQVIRALRTLPYHDQVDFFGPRRNGRDVDTSDLTMDPSKTTVLSKLRTIQAFVNDPVNRVKYSRAIIRPMMRTRYPEELKQARKDADEEYKSAIKEWPQKLKEWKQGAESRRPAPLTADEQAKEEKEFAEYKYYLERHETHWKPRRPIDPPKNSKTKVMERFKSELERYNTNEKRQRPKEPMRLADRRMQLFKDREERERPKKPVPFDMAYEAQRILRLDTMVLRYNDRVVFTKEDMKDLTQGVRPDTDAGKEGRYIDNSNPAPVFFQRDSGKKIEDDDDDDDVDDGQDDDEAKDESQPRQSRSAGKKGKVKLPPKPMRTNQQYAADLKRRSSEQDIKGAIVLRGLQRISANLYQDRSKFNFFSRLNKLVHLHKSRDDNALNELSAAFKSMCKSMIKVAVGSVEEAVATAAADLIIILDSIYRKYSPESGLTELAREFDYLYKLAQDTEEKYVSAKDRVTPTSDCDALYQALGLEESGPELKQPLLDKQVRIFERLLDMQKKIVAKDMYDLDKAVSTTLARVYKSVDKLTEKIIDAFANARQDLSALSPTSAEVLKLTESNSKLFDLRSDLIRARDFAKNATEAFEQRYKSERGAFLASTFVPQIDLTNNRALFRAESTQTVSELSRFVATRAAIANECQRLLTIEKYVAETLGSSIVATKQIKQISEAIAIGTKATKAVAELNLVAGITAAADDNTDSKSGKKAGSLSVVAESARSMQILIYKLQRALPLNYGSVGTTVQLTEQEVVALTEQEAYAKFESDYKTAQRDPSFGAGIFAAADSASSSSSYSRVFVAAETTNTVVMIPRVSISTNPVLLSKQFAGSEFTDHYEAFSVGQDFLDSDNRLHKIIGIAKSPATKPGAERKARLIYRDFYSKPGVVEVTSTVVDPATTRFVMPYQDIKGTMMLASCTATVTGDETTLQFKVGNDIKVIGATAGDILTTLSAMASERRTEFVTVDKLVETLSMVFHNRGVKPETVQDIRDRVASRGTLANLLSTTSLLPKSVKTALTQADYDRILGAASNPPMQIVGILYEAKVPQITLVLSRQEDLVRSRDRAILYWHIKLAVRTIEQGKLSIIKVPLPEQRQIAAKNDIGVTIHHPETNAVYKSDPNGRGLLERTAAVIKNAMHSMMSQTSCARIGIVSTAAQPLSSVSALRDAVRGIVLAHHAFGPYRVPRHSFQFPDVKDREQSLFRGLLESKRSDLVSSDQRLVMIAYLLYFAKPCKRAVLIVEGLANADRSTFTTIGTRVATLWYVAGPDQIRAEIQDRELSIRSLPVFLGLEGLYYRLDTGVRLHERSPDFPSFTGLFAYFNSRLQR